MGTQKTSDHKLRVQSEMAGAGMTRLALLKSSSRYLHHVIHADEHVQAIASGHYEGGSAVLVATDRRIIFLDHKPLFTSTDELTYGVVSGIKSFYSGPFASLTLHTAAGDYQLRRVNKICAQNFVLFIEQKKIEKTDLAKKDALNPNTTIHNLGASMPPDAQAFMQAHDVAVLSTVNQTGNVYGAAVYYTTSEKGDKLYVLARSETAKVRNILENQQVALTVFEENPARTLQLRGTAELETDEMMKNYISTQMINPRQYSGSTQLPPVASLTDGDYVVIRITITFAKYKAFQEVNQEH